MNFVQTRGKCCAGRKFEGAESYQLRRGTDKLNDAVASGPSQRWIDSEHTQSASICFWFFHRTRGHDRHKCTCGPETSGSVFSQCATRRELAGYGSLDFLFVDIEVC